MDSIITPEDTIFSIDEENKKCVDCSSPNPTMVSINNGVTLCEACAKIHSEFGTPISYLRPIKGEFDDYLLNFLVMGSNAKFIRSLEALGVNMQLPVQQKYKTYAADYYRRNLKAKVMGLKPLDVDFANANDIVETPLDNFTEFSNYQLKKENPVTNPSSENTPEVKAETKEKEKPQEKETTGKKIKGFFGMIGKKFKAVGGKIENLKITEKIKLGGHKTMEGLKKAGTFVADKTAPATSKIKQGASFVGSHVKSAYEDLKVKIVKKEQKKEGDAIIVNINEGENKVQSEEPPKQNEQEIKQNEAKPEVNTQEQTTSTVTPKVEEKVNNESTN